jgi:hypothetical protein
MPEVDVNATLEVDDGVGGQRPLSVDDFKTDQTGGASEAGQAALLAELQQKLEPAHLAPLASDASVVAVRDRLPAGGAASEATSLATRDNVATATARLEAIRDRLPAALDGGRLAVATDLDLAPLATAVRQDAQTAALGDLLAAVGPLATEAKLEAIRLLLAGTVDIEAAALPLPAGAATSAKQDAAAALLTSIDGHVDGVETLLGPLATEAKLEAVRALLAGAATAVKQDTMHADLLSIDGHVDGIEGLLGGLATEGKLEAVRTLLAGTLLVDGSAHNQPITAAALPLPAGAATSAKQDTAQARLDLLASEAKLEAVRALLAGTIAVDTEIPAAVLLADALSLPTTPRLGSINSLYNGSTVDLQRANVELAVLASAARTATTSSADVTNHNGRGVIIFWNVSAYAGATSMQLKLQVKDPISGNYADALVPAARASAGMTAYGWYPGASQGGSLSGSTAGLLGRTFRITVTHSDGTGQTYSVGVALIV